MNQDVSNWKDDNVVAIIIQNGDRIGVNCTNPPSFAILEVLEVAVEGYRRALEESMKDILLEEGE